MSLVTLVLVLLIVGFLVYMLFTAPIPIHPWFKNLIVGIVFIALVIWLLQLLGVHTGLPGLRL